MYNGRKMHIRINPNIACIYKSEKFLRFEIVFKLVSEVSVDIWCRRYRRKFFAVWKSPNCKFRDVTARAVSMYEVHYGAFTVSSEIVYYRLKVCYFTYELFSPDLLLSLIQHNLIYLYCINYWSEKCVI